LFKAVAEHLVGSDDDNGKSGGKPRRVRGLDDFSPQGLGNLAWSFARQAQLIGETNARVEVAADVLKNSGRMSIYAASFFDIGEILLQRLFNALAETDLRVHGTCFPSYCSARLRGILQG